MRKFGVIVITGLPGTGKTTLARQLAARYAIPLIAKDTIKEPLLDMLESGGARSRILSNISFSVMFAMAREMLAADVDLILEGNFRSGEHEPSLLSAISKRQTPVFQVLCTLDETARLERLAARAADAARHPGHRDDLRRARVPECDAFLEVPGRRFRFAGDHEPEAEFQALLSALDPPAPNG